MEAVSGGGDAAWRLPCPTADLSAMKGEGVPGMGHRNSLGWSAGVTDTDGVARGRWTEDGHAMCALVQTID